MAENENYIGVAMGLDVTSLKAGIAEANKSIQLANSEFKAASSGMDDWTKSTEGLSAKVKQLDTVLGAQKSKLAGMQAEYKKVAASQGENSEAARRLQVQINNQQAVVNATQKEFNNYTETLKQATAGNLDLETASLKAGKAVKKSGDDAADAGGKMDGIKSVAGGVVAGMAAIGTAAVGLVGGFLSLAESTREFREDTEKLNTAFDAANLSAESASDTYRTLFGAIGESDTAVEASQQIALLANSEEEVAKWADLATGVVGKFGDALKPEAFYEAANETLKLGEATGAYTQMLEQSGYSVDTFNAGLAACNTEEEKQAYMLEISNQLLGEASEHYKENAKDIIAAREAEAALTQATAELGAIAEPIMTTLKLLAVELLESITPFVQLIGEGLTGAFSGAAGSAEKLAEGLGGVLNIIVERITSLLPTVLNIILQLIPSIVDTLLSALPSLLSTVTTLVIQILNLLTQLMPEILSKIVEIIPQLIDSLVSAIPLLLQAATQLLLAIVRAIPTLVSSLVSALPQVIDTIIRAVVDSIPILLDAAIQLLDAIVKAIPVLLKSLSQNLPKIIDTILTGVLDALPLLLDAAVTLFEAVIDAIDVILPILISELPKILNSILTALTDALPQILQAAISLFTQIVQAIPRFLPQLVSMLPRIISTITTVLLQNLPLILRAGVQLLVALIQGLVQAIPQLVKMLPQIISAIVKGLAAGAKELAKAGKKIVEGIWQGIKDAGNWIKEKITGFAGNVAGWFKKAFKIKSPSRLMADEVGEYVGEGVGVGVLDSIPTVKKQLGKFGAFVKDNLGGIKAGLTLDSNLGGGAGSGTRGRVNGGTIINAGQTIYYNGNLSRKQLKQLETDNYTAIKLRLQSEGVI